MLILDEFCKLDPAAVDELADKNERQVKHMAEAVAGLADRMPHAARRKTSQLLLFLGCRCGAAPRGKVVGRCASAEEEEPWGAGTRHNECTGRLDS